MLTLYLILLAIAALGFIALTMIAISYYKPKPKKYTASHLSDAEETTIAIHEPVVLPQQSTAATTNDEDTTLASLGFSALDVVQEEPHPATLAPAAAAAPVTPIATHTISKPEKTISAHAEPIVFYLLAAQDQQFTGYELLQALLSADLRFGDKRIFHRHDPIEGEHKKIQFSIASAVEPGIFDMANIGGFSCPGLCIFMAPDKVDDPIYTFDLMLETAQQLADDLNGELCNEYREPLTEEEIDEHRATITA